ncbi:MAG TPA: type III-A CRISPR-associated RAMP protein Csm3, partial [bacterium]|nr:type III-A CRISPR-associated RAMP protein Csm3 [bacterium]
RIWGIMGDKIKDNDAFTLTRVIIRDTYLDESSITEEMRRNMDLEWTEVKMETAIDRFTGTAKGGSLRQIERIPAGAIFKPMEILFNIFEENDKDLLMKIFEAMELLEHDYLGGMGSRGYGQIKFKDIDIFWNSKRSYTQGAINQNKISNGFTTPVEILKNFETIKENIKNES